MADTQPALGRESTAPVVVVTPSVGDQKTGALWVHGDLKQVIAPWDAEAHISPPRGNEPFGDVESWAEFVKRFAEPDVSLLTWDSTGLRAVLDYHDDLATPGRAQFIATMPFYLSEQWLAWKKIANGQPISHRQAIEALEDRGEEIVAPPQAELMSILKSLRTTLNQTAQTETLDDGTTRIGFTKDQGVKSLGGLDIPGTFTIQIPVMKGSDKVYGMQVRVRLSVDNEAHLTLRLTIPAAELALDRAWKEIVDAANVAVAPLHLLRAAG